LVDTASAAIDNMAAQITISAGAPLAPGQLQLVAQASTVDSFPLIYE
jgi:hypothetical protein